jgi:hypothetical protein
MKTCSSETLGEFSSTARHYGPEERTVYMCALGLWAYLFIWENEIEVRRVQVKQKILTQA